ncbi:MAG: hypothetical protein AAF639_14840 [Chloroflexota bacterium]
MKQDTNYIAIRLEPELSNQILMALSECGHIELASKFSTAMGKAQIGRTDPCEQCGNEFTNEQHETGRKQKYCSHRCRQKAYRQRKKSGSQRRHYHAHQEMDNPSCMSVVL